MKKMFYLFAAAAAVTLMTGCTTVPTAEKVNWQLPDKFEFGSKKETVHVQFRPVGIHSSDIDRESAALIRKEFSSIVLAKLIRSKRFTITETTKKHEHQSDIIVTPSLKFNGTKGSTYMLTSAVLTMDLKVKDFQSGEFIDAACPIQAVSHRDVNRLAKSRIIFGKIEPLPRSVRMSLVTSCFEEAYRMLEKGLNELYPVSAAIQAPAKVIGNKVSFAIAKGSNHGIESSDEALICYVDESNRITVVALAAGQIGRYNSTLNVVFWNPFDPEAASIASGIAGGQKYKLYAVFRKAQ